MKMLIARIYRLALFVLLSLTLIISCSKDNDILQDAIFEQENAPVDSQDSADENSEAEEEEEETPDETTDEEETEEEQTDEDSSNMEEEFESRTTTFSPMHDAHVQDGKGFNQSVMRLDNEERTSYLLFNLSQIDSIGGTITDAVFQFTVNADEGDGEIVIYKGLSNDWTEDSIGAGNTPEIDIPLGSINKEYKLGITENVILSASDLIPEQTTLILSHETGNDLAIASKEHPSEDGPKLIVTYNAPTSAEEIVPDQGDTGDGTIEDDANNGGNQDEGTSNGNEAPVANLSANPTSGEAPLEVSFTGDTSTDDKSITKYSWNFKDGSFSSEANPTHTFTEGGTYNVKLTVEDEDGLEASKNITITVDGPQNAAPVAKISATPKTGTVPLEVAFKGDDSTDDKAITKYSWNFRDGNFSSEANPTHTYEQVGTYKAKLTVEDEKGLTSVATVTITVESPNNEAPVARASGTPTSGTAPLDVAFKGNTSTDDKEITKYTWDFKDGDTSSAKNPTHTFTAPGTYKVSLTVEDEEGEEDTAIVNITVNGTNNEAPTAVAKATPNSGEAPLTVQFNANSSSDDEGIASYHWDFGTSNPASNKNPSRTFNEPGEYEVTLTVTDDEGLEDTDTVTVTVTGSGGGGGGGGGGGNYPPGHVLASSFGYNANNATEAFQDAIKSNSNYIVIDKQSGPWIIEPSRFFSISNKTIFFEPGVVLKAKSGAYGHIYDVMFNFYNGSNLEIIGYGATLQMNKNEYNNGEWRHAMKLDGCTNVTVKGFDIKDSGGDGININSGGNGFSKDITIEDVVCSNNRRMGLTVTSGQNIWVRNSEFRNSKGTAPEAGVDLEPNKASDRLVNINFINCKFIGNDAAGFTIGTLKMTSASTPISVVVKNSSFSNNAVSPPSGKPSTEININQGLDSNPVKGSVLFDNITFNGSSKRLFFSRKSDKAFHVTFRNCTANNVITSGQHPPIELEARTSTSSLGGFTFDNFYIQYTKNQPFMRVSAPNGFPLKNITGTFTIKEPNDNPLDWNNGASPQGGQNVDIDYTHIN